MKLASTLATAALTLATIGFASPTPDESITLNQRDNELFARKSCSGSRTSSDRCSGKRLRPQHSWHNCNNQSGKCCAINKDGSGGMDVKKGLGREDCGYCFGGKCQG
ncbi:hypothetical protein HRG_008943 [Hirsutella rhossiliensis]|uniref:Uncharacterized protein n=1 Tax=Hirsutella rhossiliensis TaxID=111463 RepID=A0A9P8MVG7_9HYPO|nr:uncharacterized protein HRG_08943 [Hirsutella rhossiliensis]KAH0959922.1 hypothetical protein HRG_08943 [Hirsutella rhossiliensis]